VLCLLVLALLAVALAACVRADDGGTADREFDGASPAVASLTTTTSRPPAGEAADRMPEKRFAELPPAAWMGPTLGLEELPPEALVTLQLIAAGGPFPYDQDGGTFQNREGILPDAPLDFYAEYTVETPGSPDRGARRLVVGDDLFVYYTDDHYDSFSFVTG
jgi:ribonuclease T1